MKPNGNKQTSESAEKEPNSTEEKPQEEEPEEETKSAAPTAQESDDDGDSDTGDVLEMNIPAVGESITEVTISEWVKEDGEHVAMDEVIAEIESDKATFELTAEAEGTLRIVAEAGTTLEIGVPGVPNRNRRCGSRPGRGRACPIVG